MPNFHSNALAIAANEENMRKALVHFGTNLAANTKHTEFELEDLDGLETARDLFYGVGPQIRACYPFAFQPLFDAPSARGVSEIASIELTRYGQNWLLTIGYDTAWHSNEPDIDGYFLSLPKGDYGVAFYGADEGDGYEAITVRSGLHHGEEGLCAIDGDESCDVISNAGLKKRKHKYANASRTKITGLAELAKFGATFSLPNWTWEDDEDEDECVKDKGDETVSLWYCPPVNWRRPKGKDLRKIDGLITSAVSSFPWVLDCGSRFTSEGSEAVELLFPGDDVKVVSDWTSAEMPGKVMFKVYDAKGTAIGYADDCVYLYEEHEENTSSSSVLASLLPHLRTTVWELTPASLRNAGTGFPSLSIRFDLEPVDIEALIAETHALLEKDLEERALSSKGGM